MGMRMEKHLLLLYNISLTASETHSKPLIILVILIILILIIGLRM